MNHTSSRQDLLYVLSLALLTSAPATKHREIMEDVGKRFLSSWRTTLRYESEADSKVSTDSLQAPEVLSCLGYNIRSQFHLDPTSWLLANLDVEEDLWIVFPIPRSNFLWSTASASHVDCCFNAYCTHTLVVKGVANRSSIESPQYTLFSADYTNIGVV